MSLCHQGNNFLGTSTLPNGGISNSSGRLFTKWVPRHLLSCFWVKFLTLWKSAWEIVVSLNFAPLKSAFIRITHLKSVLSNFVFMNFVVIHEEFLNSAPSRFAEVRSAPSNLHSINLVLTRFANFRFAPLKSSLWNVLGICRLLSIVFLFLWVPQVCSWPSSQ